ncbi:PREDICTED: maltase 1-like [Polistes canadensis]|uniref:maltase 1-like n=1 Tax=Polistes canadensis TaxID=91411 RepID=UPI000718EE67|nr:PREDICTED: maltase 1-like [Polistes canadensis]
MIHSRQYVFIFLCYSFASLTIAEIRNKGWWKNAVFYQICPRSFKDSDLDGIGDLVGITNKLQYFVESGVTGIWLSSINKSPMKDFGYDISDFRDIHPDYGTMEDFNEFIKRAKHLGLKVILDLVPNHTSDQHEWFINSVKGDGKYADYYIWVNKNKENPPNNWLSVFGNSSWTYNEQRKAWYYHQFLSQQPDLNYRNPEVVFEMQQIIEYWLNKGVDGFYIDAVPHLFEVSNIELNEPINNATKASKNEYDYLKHIYTKDQEETYTLIHNWRNIVNSYTNIHNEEEKVIMTEAYTSLENTIKFYKYGSDVPFNFKFITDVNNKSSATDFKKTIDSWFKAMPNGSVANWVMGNHDRSRMASRYPGRADQMTMLAMVLPGVAITYYGEEIGMTNNEAITFKETQDTQACAAGEEGFQKKSRDPYRTPFQWDKTTFAGFTKGKKSWLPINHDYTNLNLKDQQENKNNESHYKIYTALMDLRNTMSVMKNGSYQSMVIDKNILVISRFNEHQLVTLVINFLDDKPQIVDLKVIAGKKSLNSTIVKVASVNSKVPINKAMVDHSVNVPAKASIVLYSTYSNASINYNNYLLTILLLVSTIVFKL